MTQTLTPLPDWVTWLIAAGAVITAIAVIWRKVVRPLSSFLTQADELGPVIRTIAKEFKNNNGSTLRDRIDALEVAVAQARDVAAKAQAAADRAAAAAQRVADDDHSDVQALLVDVRTALLRMGDAKK